MKLFFIRHAESEHNTKGILAGVTDSALTSHGVSQAERLARYFRDQGIQFSRILSSDLQRARLTAEALVHGTHQGENHTTKEPVGPLVLLESLREKNFGSREGQSWSSSGGPAPDEESRSSLETRAKVFLDENILPLLASDNARGEVVAVVSHGQILSMVWRCLVAFFGEKAISTAPGVDRIPVLPWSNTGYLELEIKRVVSDPATTANSMTISPSNLTEQACTSTVVAVPPAWHVKILTVNGQHHVKTLKRTRGGIGSSRHDKSQRQIDSFFMKPKADN